MYFSTPCLHHSFADSALQPECSSFASGRLCTHTHTLVKMMHLLCTERSNPAQCFLQLRCVLTVAPRARWSFLAPCDPKLFLGNTATQLGGSAEQNCARHSIGDVRALISLGGLADGRSSETFDATLDESRRRQRERQARSCAELPASVLCCVRGALGGRLLPCSRMGRAAEERV